MKRAVAIAFINATSQLGNIAGSYVYPIKWAPTYQKSFGIALCASLPPPLSPSSDPELTLQPFPLSPPRAAMFMATFVGLFVHRLMLKRENAKIEEAESRDASPHPLGFRYLL